MEWSRFVFFISFIFLLFFLSLSFYRNTCHGCGSLACSRRQLVLRSLELCEIPSTWDWTITKLTQATPIKGDTQLSNIYFIIIYFYYMSDLPVLFYFGPTYTETYCRLIWGKGEVYLRARTLSPPDLVLCTLSLHRSCSVSRPAVCHSLANICWSRENYNQTTCVSSKFMGALI